MKKYKYTQKQNLKTTLDIGEITPIYWNMLYPGEKVENLNFRNITRMITPIYPTLDQPYINVYTFAVPVRILSNEANNYNDIQGNIMNNISYISHKNDSHVPHTYQLCWLTRNLQNPNGEEQNELYRINRKFNEIIDYNAIANYNGLLSKFGIMSIEKEINDEAGDKTKIPQIPSTFNMSYLLAYWKVYYDFFRNKQLEKFDYNQWVNYLTFKGEVNDLYVPYATVQKMIENDADAWRDASPDAEDIEARLAATRLFDVIPKANVKNEILNALQFEKSTLPIQTTWENFKKTINDNFIKNQRLNDHVQLGTIKDTLLSIWHENNNDKTNAKLIGFSEYRQSISQVVNQAQTESNALGEIGGLSVTYNEDHLVNSYEVNEPTIILTVAVANYDMQIIGALDKYEWGTSFNEFTPMMEIPLEELKAEYIPGIDTNDDAIIGYVTPYNYLRNKNDVIAGEIMGNWRNWTYAVNLKDNFPPGVGLKLLKVNKKPFKETLVSPQQDSFITEWEFIATYNRTIKPEYELKEDAIKGE